MGALNQILNGTSLLTRIQSNSLPLLNLINESLRAALGFLTRLLYFCWFLAFDFALRLAAGLYFALVLAWPAVVALNFQVACFAHFFAKHLTVRVLTSSREFLAPILHVAPATHALTKDELICMGAMCALLVPRDLENVRLLPFVQ